MPATPAFTPRLAVRHVQLGRAVLAAIAAAMITFSADHSAAFGLAVFSGFTITTALVLAFAAWMSYPTGRKWPAGSLALFGALAGMASGVPIWRTTPLFFVVLICWALLTGIIETIAGWRERAELKREGIDDPDRRAQARDTLTVGIATLVLAAALALVPVGYRLRFFIAEAGRTFTLTGITIGVGVFGFYVAIVAVFLGIAAFSPQRLPAAAAEATAPPLPGDSA